MKKVYYVPGLIVIFIIIIFFYVRPTSEDYDFKINSTSEEINFIRNNLVSGGPPKDGIPSIDNPIYLSSAEADLDDDDVVFGVNYNGFVAAYPKSIMFWHEIVNEEVNGEKISLTYCPLTESIIGYNDVELGVSGELYNSNLVAYDRLTGARIPQIYGKAIEGSIEGKEFETFEVIVTTWGKWKAENPDSLVLSTDTGFNRDYDRSPYPGYDKIYNLWFPVAAESDELRSKDIVLGIEGEKDFVAIEKEGFLDKYPDGLDIIIGNETVKVIYDKNFGALRTNNSNIKSFEVYWFAWYAYHPNTELIKTDL
ncbi:MAG: DUF3179 domain-containing protein [Nanoarchaeota archaeon]|nr:DUF3179 domain-containing protein [Nanoarchaeota archaeon]